MHWNVLFQCILYIIFMAARVFPDSFKRMRMGEFMTLYDKVNLLVRYCAQHQSHGFMMDERNTDESFHVSLPQEEQIRSSIHQIRVIILTGEAGDGKSRILRNIGPLLTDCGFGEPCRDFSALPEEKKKALIVRLRQVLDGKSDEKLMILANVGVFTQTAIRYDIHLMEELTNGREDVFICNFEKRNLAEDKAVFGSIVSRFLLYDQPCANRDCICFADCAYRNNIEKLLTDSGIEGLRTICNAIYLTGGHLTFRELLSLLAYAVTFGQDCGQRVRCIAEGGVRERFLYYNIFEKSSDVLLHKIADMDPALKRGTCRTDIQTSSDYIRHRRRQFFAEQDKQYEMLRVDYLPEFYAVLTYMNQRPYHYDVSRDKNEILRMLKRGINKMSSQGRSDAGLVVTDTPPIFDGRIRVEFLGLADVALIWNRYDLRAGQAADGERLWNRFCLSYMVSTKRGKELISLVIDYRLFCYLMMCSQDYFMNRNASSTEENVVNTFYRKILQQKEQIYSSIVIRFEEKNEEICDFSLHVHAEEDLFSGETTRSIRIRKED